MIDDEFLVLRREDLAEGIAGMQSHPPLAQVVDNLSQDCVALVQRATAAEGEDATDVLGEEPRGEELLLPRRRRLYSDAFPRPDVAYVPITDIPPGQIALAWNETQPSSLVTDLVQAATADRTPAG